MMGMGRRTPTWAIIISVSKDFGMAPWEFWYKCPPLWWNRILTYRQCEQMAKNHESGDFDDEEDEDEDAVGEENEARE